MTNEKNVPELRFPEFEDEWKENFISEIVDFYSGLTYSPDDITNEKGTFVIRSSNIKNNRLINADNVYVNLKNLKVEMVNKGDIIVVVRNGSRKLIGKHALVSTYLNNTVIGAFMTGIRSDYNLFINALLDTENFKRNIHMNLGATINQITTGMFKKMNFYFPENGEQQKIGGFFSKLDRQIELEEQKLEKLEEQKKGYMQKIFSQELRFKDENGNDYPTWKKTTIKEVAKLTVGKSKKNENTGKYIIMDMGTVTKNGTMLTHKSTPHENDLLNKGDLVMPKDDIGGGHIIGKTVFIPESQKYVLGDHVYRLETKKCNGLFLHFYINSDIVNRSLKRKVTGSAQLGLNRKSVEEELVKVPCLEEQEKIGAFFSKLDTFIEKQLSKIELLKERKKSFLQKMFV